MRELKFRIFDKRFNEYRYWGFVKGSFIGPPTGGGFDINECNELSERFTGLLDKCGVEIYEGDIVSFGTISKHVVEYKEWRRVSYGHGDCGENYGVGFDMGSSYGTNNTVKVIGNIYQNPELLK